MFFKRTTLWFTSLVTYVVTDVMFCSNVCILLKCEHVSKIQHNFQPEGFLCGSPCQRNTLSFLKERNFLSCKDPEICLTSLLFDPQVILCHKTLRVWQQIACWCLLHTTIFSMLLPGTKRFLLTYLLLSSTEGLCSVSGIKAFNFLQMPISVAVGTFNFRETNCKIRSKKD